MDPSDLLRPLLLPPYLTVVITMSASYCYVASLTPCLLTTRITYFSLCMDPYDFFMPLRSLSFRSPSHHVHRGSSSALQSDRPLKLNCLIHGDDPSRAFSVTIASGESVGDLREAIFLKQKHALRNVDANHVDIFKVSLAHDGNLGATLKHFQPKDDPSNGIYHLSAITKQLKAVFSDIIDDYLHVIVVGPSIGECSTVCRNPAASYFTISRDAFLRSPLQCNMA